MDRFFPEGGTKKRRPGRTNEPLDLSHLKALDSENAPDEESLMARTENQAAARFRQSLGYRRSETITLQRAPR